jgi:hypothetical protein
MAILQSIYVATYYRDLIPLYYCLRSIRRHYPSIPIYVLKDCSRRSFSIPYLSEFQAIELVSPEYNHGAFNKLIPLSRLPGDGYTMVLDSDILMVQSISPDLLTGDVVIWPEFPEKATINRCYYQLDNLGNFDPEFRYPGYNFNTGQIIARQGVVGGPLMDKIVSWNANPKVDKSIFRLHEQGALNYVIQKMEQLG